MKSLTTLVFLILFGIVLFFYLKLVPKHQGRIIAEPAPPIEKVIEKKKMLDLAADDKITWLQLQNLQSNKISTFALEDHTWVLKYPVDYPADPEFMNGILDMLQSLKRDKNYLPEKSWDEYGLMRPNYKIGIETALDPRRRYLLLGDLSPVDHELFARWETEKGYFLVHPFIKEVFVPSLYALREKRIFRHLDGIMKIEFEINEKKWTIEKKENRWIWNGPLTASAQPFEDSFFKELVEQLRSLWIKEFLDKNTLSLTDLGLADTKNGIRIWTKDQQGEFLEVGGEYLKRNSFYAKRRGEKAIFLLDRDKLGDIFSFLISQAPVETMPKVLS